MKPFLYINQPCFLTLATAVHWQKLLLTSHSIHDDHIHGVKKLDITQHLCSSSPVLCNACRICFFFIRRKFIGGAQLLVHSPILTIYNNTQYKLNTIFVTLQNMNMFQFVILALIILSQHLHFNLQYCSCHKNYYY